MYILLLSPAPKTTPLVASLEEAVKARPSAGARAALASAKKASAGGSIKWGGSTMTIGAPRRVTSTDRPDNTTLRDWRISGVACTVLTRYMATIPKGGPAQLSLDGNKVLRRGGPAVALSLDDESAVDLQRRGVTLDPAKTKDDDVQAPDEPNPEPKTKKARG